MMACNVVNAGRWCQETYETATRDAAKRARQLRALGYMVSVVGIGPQVTPVGVIRMTLVDVRPGAHADTLGLPAADAVTWPR
jgi:hypothetical protein